MLIIENIYNTSSRSGNIFFFIINCISDNILYYNHDKISLKYVKNNFIIFKNIPEILYFPEFANNVNNSTIIKDLFVIPKCTVNSKEIINKYIKPYIDYNLTNDFGINFENDLIIHIRSGDVFSKDFINNKHMFNCFISPPYSFYKEIIEKNNFNKIYIISENFNLNPVIEKILKNFKNSSFLSNDLYTDFKILLNAKFFIPGHSDLSRMVLSLSESKKNIYVSKDFFPKTENIVYYDYSNYYKINIKSFEEYIYLILNWEK